MNSTLFNIVKTISYVEEKNTELDMFEIIPLRRTHKIVCSTCGNICGMPIVIYDVPIMCVFCSNELRRKQTKLQDSFKNWKNILEKKKYVFKDIIEVGMIPNRIKQTGQFDTEHLFGTAPIEELIDI